MAPEVEKQPKPPRFERLALIGVGLIGSSIARATLRADLAASIVGCARTAKTRDKALELGIVDAGDLFQKRSTTRQVRLAIPSLTVRSL